MKNNNHWDEVVFLSVCVIMVAVTIISLVLANSHIETNHTLNLISNNETKEVFKSIADIKDSEVRQDELYCENRLLNLSREYERILYEQKQYFQVYCWKNGSYDMECFN
jgi:hypothetical protein